MATLLLHKSLLYSYGLVIFFLFCATNLCLMAQQPPHVCTPTCSACTGACMYSSVGPLSTSLVFLRDIPSDPPADAAPAHRQPHGRVRDLLRFLRNGSRLLPRDGLGVPAAREKAAARARRAGFSPPSSERPAVPQHRAGTYVTPVGSSSES